MPSQTRRTSQPTWRIRSWINGSCLKPFSLGFCYTAEATWYMRASTEGKIAGWLKIWKIGIYAVSGKKNAEIKVPIHLLQFSVKLVNIQQGNKKSPIVLSSIKDSEMIVFRKWKKKFTFKDVREWGFRRAGLPNIKHNEHLKKKAAKSPRLSSLN